MNGEKFYEPTEGELDWAMEKAREDMGEPGEPKITDEKVNKWRIIKIMNDISIF